ncbi:uncharacterized protein LOC143598590 [Bidens hawaiensis]|uniref:uncharacterized protein LOC143598590 n=1 Tax=Bidens hawaiensis TaxID=980011 RepID=UPI00404A9466
MTTFYSEEGILLETTCPHTPEKNGVVERKHRHLLETARALKFEANLPSTFWGECILTAAYIINRLPSKSINNITPYELVYNQKPNYDHMKIFGCLASYRSNETKGDKFQEKGRPGIFLGYPHGTKGYKVFDIKNKKMVVSRDVKFVETVFPHEKINFHINDEEPEIFDLPPWFHITHLEPITNKHHNSENEPNSDHKEAEDVPTNDHNSNDTESNSNDTSNGPSDHGTTKSNPSQLETQTINDQAEVETEISHETEPVRERRHRSRPGHLNDYIVNLPPSIDQTLPVSNQDSSMVHSIANFITYKNFTNSHKVLLAAIDSNDEPKTFNQAIPDANWREAMKKEICALEQNGT